MATINSERQGGLTASAYLYGTVFTRESVRQTQTENFDRALRDLDSEHVIPALADSVIAKR